MKGTPFAIRNPYARQSFVAISTGSGRFLRVNVIVCLAFRVHKLSLFGAPLCLGTQTGAVILVHDILGRSV